MSKIIKIIPSFILIIIIALTSILFDFNQKDMYQNITNDKYYPYTENIVLPKDISLKQQKDIIELARKYHVNIVYTNFNDDKKCLEFYSSDNPIKLVDNFTIKKGTNNDEIVSTINKNHQYYIHDFLNNDQMIYYPIKYLYKNKKIPLGGDVEVKYNNQDDYKQFYKATTKYLNLKDNALKSSTDYLKSHSEIVIIGILLIIILFMSFYLMITMYYILKNSYKISCLKLQGFSNNDITKVLFRLKPIIILSMIIILMTLIFEDLKFTISTIIITIILLVITKLLQKLALRLIINKNWSNLLKKEKCGNRLFNVIVFNKFLIGLIVLFLICFNVNLLIQSYQISENLNNNKGLNYGMITNINIDANVKEKNFINFYQDIRNSNIKYLYADFYRYSDESYQTYEKEYLDSLWKINFISARVDNNYLNTEKIKVYDSNNKLVNNNKLNDCFIYPKNKLKYLTNFKKYNEEHKKIYFYDNQEINTYLIEQKPNKIKDAILYVIDKNNKKTYNETPRGLDIAGTGFNTDLKFFVEKDDTNTYRLILPYLQKNHLTSAISKDCFQSGKTYKDNINNKQKLIYINILLIIIPLILLYFFVILLSFILYIDLYYEDIKIKYLLGFTRKDMFKNVLKLNLLSELTILFSGLIYNIIQFNIINCIITVLMTMISFMITILIMKKCKVR